MTTEQKETFASENDALLVEEKPEPKDAKRNSKQELIQRILDLVKKNNIEIEYSDSKLKRMTKAQLQEVLGTVMEKIMQSQMAEQLGCDRDQAYTVCSYRFDQHNRDDLERAHNDWNVLFNAPDRIDVVLGAASASRSWSLPTSEFPREWSMEPTRSNPKRLWPARVGEVLLLHTLDPDDDGWFGLQVIGMEEGEWVMLRYEQVDPLENGALWVDQLPEQLLLDGDVQLRIRPGQDPNPHRIYLTGVGTQRVERVVNFPFDPDLVQPEQDSWAWAKGGWIPRGKAYVMGGCTSRSKLMSRCDTIAESVEVYDPEVRAWKAAPSMTSKRRLHAATALVVGGTARRIYVVGGCSGASCHKLNSTSEGTALRSGEALLEKV